MKKENPNALISLGFIVFLAGCIFGIGYVTGHRGGYDAGSKAVAEIDRVLLDKKADEISDLNDRLTRAKAFVEKYGASSWEVDALPPDILILLCESFIKSFLDQKKMDAIIKQENKDKKQLRNLVK